MSGASVLLVEDDPAVAEVVATGLGLRGYSVRTATTGRTAVELLDGDPPDLVVLDLGLPDADGVELCRRIRLWWRRPILVLSADGSEARKVAALDAGADDYVTKPFSMAELLARLRVAERHWAVASQVVDDDAVTVGDLRVDTAARTASAGGAALDLTRKEFALLALLARNSGKVLTHGALLGHVWGAGRGSRETLRVHVAQLRRKLGHGPLRPVLASEPATGYRLVLPDHPPGPHTPETQP